jgi:hypothetical protein
MARHRSQVVLAPPRQLVATSRGLIEDHAPGDDRAGKVRAIALTLLRLEAMADAALHDYGALISHTVIDGETVQCVFERGTITKKVN